MSHWVRNIPHFWQEQTIYIDGMASFIGSEPMEEYMSIWLTQGGWNHYTGPRG